MRSLFSNILLNNWLFLLVLLSLAIFSYIMIENFVELSYKFIVLSIYVIFAMYGAFYVSYNIAKNISDRLKIIEKKTRDINAGDFGSALPIPNIKELAELSESINTMSRRLKLQFSDLSLEKEKFNSLLLNLKEGVFAIDLDQKILFQNKNVPKNLIPSNSQFRDIYDAIENEEFYQFLINNIQNGTDGKLNINLNGKHYSIWLYPLKPENRILMFIGVVLDITEEVMRQIMKEQFVQNTSHELKTPITSIKGYSETLLLKLNPEKNSIEKKFLQTILRNTDRMVRIVEDMLTLSKLDSHNMIFQPEFFFLNDLIENVRLTIEGVFSVKKQTLEVDIKENFQLYADIILFEHVFLNLLQNASAYSFEETKIQLKAFTKNEQNIIQIIDQGIGIPEEHEKKIFERFYRVDTNRSRKQGGTGLGLSIVKNIIKLHKGEIAVSPNFYNEGKGSIFTIVIPKDENTFLSNNKIL